MAKRGPRTITAGGTMQQKQVRCAIYTRKSTEEGLDQAFNSLDAQREACAAYIASQRHEGWIAVPALYDDGGYSGGTMERPGLKRLLAAVHEGRIDVIVVYKVDRLTRALADFAKIVEVLDDHGASFVSVTQAFNTTSSMGRLTLNVLLSFAQFEREVTGERIRDKIAASKKKGMWMGGPVPLGYDVIERKLIVNEVEAATVRLIFERHQALGTISGLAADIEMRGIRSRLRTMRDGRLSGGKPYGDGALGHLLRSVLYVGRIRHGDQTYAGQHLAILDQATWDASQALLDRSKLRPHTGQLNLLAGMVHDEAGRPLASEHAIKGTRRYRYYVTRLVTGQVGKRWRLPAGDLEAIVGKGVHSLFDDPTRIASELGHPQVDADLRKHADQIASRIHEPAALRSVLQQLKATITVCEARIDVVINGAALATMLHLPGGASSKDDVRLGIAANLKRRGHELRLVYAAREARPAERDARLIQLLGRGYAAYDRLLARNADATTRRHLTRMARLRFLAPDIVSSILEGRQPVELTSRSLLRASDLPLRWDQQRTLLGFA